MLDRLREVLADVGLQDGFGFDDLVLFCAGAVTVLGFVSLFLVKPFRALVRFLEWADDFRDDWFGAEARDGRSKSPGVMERLNRLDGEFQRNGGKTMKDSQYRTERAVHRIEDRMAGDDVYLGQVVDVIEQNINAIGDAMAAGGFERPAYRPFPPRPGIIVRENPEEGP